ncbi:MAG: GpE family phage tail protein [Ottowia sp.]|nr:GpE family phage tail protein [Ottowia sp.]
MADIATVFHWSPEYLLDLELSELMAWRERARLRNNVDESI